MCHLIVLGKQKLISFLRERRENRSFNSDLFCPKPSTSIVYKVKFRKILTEVLMLCGYFDLIYWKLFLVLT